MNFYRKYSIELPTCFWKVERNIVTSDLESVSCNYSYFGILIYLHVDYGQFWKRKRNVKFVQLKVTG